MATIAVPELPALTEDAAQSGGWRVSARGTLHDLVERTRRTPTTGGEDDAVLTAALTRAADALSIRKKPWSAWWSGALVEETWQSLHRAAALMPLVRPADRMAGELQVVRARATSLPETHPLRLAVTDAQLDTRIGNPTPADREVMSQTLSAVHAIGDARFRTVRSWRNRLLITAAVAVVSLLALLVLAAMFPATLPMCPSPQATPAAGAAVCPSGWATASGGDAAKVALVGILAGGVLAGVFALRNTEPSASAYRITPALSGLRVALAGLTAVIGVLIVQSGSLPGFSGLTSTGQIALYAVVFGFSQEAVTQLLEGRAKAVQQATQPEVSPAA